MVSCNTLQVHKFTEPAPSAAKQTYNPPPPSYSSDPGLADAAFNHSSKVTEQKPGYHDDPQIPPTYGTPQSYLGALFYRGIQIPDPNAPPAPLGTMKVPGYDPHPDFEYMQGAREKLRKEGDSRFRIHNENEVVVPLTRLTLQQRDALNDYFVAKTGADLETHMGEIVQDFHLKEMLKALTFGPLMFDVYLLKTCLSREMRDEMTLAEIILNRDHDDLRLLMQAFKQRHGKSLVDAIKDAALSGKTERIFVMALSLQRAPDDLPVDRNQVMSDVETLAKAAKDKDDIPFIEVIVNRSRPHLAAVIETFAQTQLKSLSKAVKKVFPFTSRYSKKALLFIVNGVKPWRDAKMIDKTMTWVGTNEFRLVWRVIGVHWDPRRLGAVKSVYEMRYGKTLEQRVSTIKVSGRFVESLLAFLKTSQAASQHVEGKGKGKAM
ncbi:hypothetical protein CC1G_00714 [Coprinopsis cinerea okayama7|uniref:Annexin n=1 Tax=Coprinopsis cinerea (strain Okayama-7 / 130 / ATCC MYA-4618 / FGSC 9003) TaxID=240176 RepID=A8N3U4_COPC7|nr:hypothetical protein CC1G_00714 [Coprinopsis cinerea okayama7\|eukprot:XP_001829535.2 hypothetical protein CC1G_00714 [Coprinopsis cinerea okayama7\